LLFWPLLFQKTTILAFFIRIFIISYRKYLATLRLTARTYLLQNHTTALIRRRILSLAVFSTPLPLRENVRIFKDYGTVVVRDKWIECCETGLHNILPAGHMRPAKAFLAARESFLNCGKCCESSTSNKLSLQNFFHTTTKSLHRNERLLPPAGNLWWYRAFWVVQACCKR